MNEIITVLLVLLLYKSIVFIISTFLKRNDIVDVSWGIGFVVSVLFANILFQNSNFLVLLVNSLVSLWGMRLAFYIFIRNLRKSEDQRYLDMVKNWGKNYYIRSFLQIFILQGILLYIIVLPVIYINSLTEFSFNIVNYIGLVVWILGFLVEAIADFQMFIFKQNKSNKGRIITSGLWKYSRHPNYFGEVLVWWGIFLITIQNISSFVFIFSPILITYLILKVSGIPLLEKKYQNNEEYIEYSKKTSIFLLLPNKK